MGHTVRQMLDRLHGGQASLDQVCADFRGRAWPAGRMLTAAQVHGVHDTDPPGDNEWAAVDADSRLTPDQYQALANARAAATGGGYDTAQ